MSDELVEVWQLEFYKAMKEISAVNFTFVGGIPIPEPRSGKSASLVIGVAWKAFLSAKRSQPVIELPGNSKNDAAGYQYKVKE